ncbi:protein Simiate isoform X1 [Selaginella moellendorffii]|uniref:protein Simiate isoform X1 n=1 Tax=Selaginella moellendorffii TaxID=88036 RepID=UPI000D1C9C46|nr:protein Simiate isoform X1 [Selaginella moellendorffii]|eukprot:XP_024544854.1 protein Simiate isoform X1 [Selaginella moellendorffii]
MDDKEEENAVLALYPRAHELPPRAPPAHETNFTHYFALDVGGKEFHDQYLYRHGNGLCVVGLAPSHLALRSPSKIKIVDYDVGKKSRADMKASGRRKKDAQVLEENSSLCKVSSEDAEFLVRCCIRGQLLEVNERLTSDPSLLSPSLARLHCDSNAKARSMEKGREITPHSRAIQAAKNATGMIIYPSLLQFFAELLFFVRDLCLRPPLLTNWKNSSGKQYFVTHTIKTPP